MGLVGGDLVQLWIDVGGEVKSTEWWNALERRVGLSSFTDDRLAAGARSHPDWQMWAVYGIAAQLELDGLNPVRVVDVDELPPDLDRRPPVAGIRVRSDGVVVDLGVRVETDGRVCASIDDHLDPRVG